MKVPSEPCHWFLLGIAIPHYVLQRMQKGRKRCLLGSIAAKLPCKILPSFCSFCTSLCLMNNKEMLPVFQYVMVIGQTSLQIFAQTHLPCWFPDSSQDQDTNLSAKHCLELRLLSPFHGTWAWHWVNFFSMALYGNQLLVASPTGNPDM